MSVSGENMKIRIEDRMTRLADDARLVLASQCRDADECRELGSMLGLIETGPSGSFVVACPWDADTGDPFLHSLTE